METPEDEAKHLIEILGIEGAKRQVVEEFGNSDNHNQELFWKAVLEIILTQTEN